jgi:hypothetical protein
MWTILPITHHKNTLQWVSLRLALAAAWVICVFCATCVSGQTPTLSPLGSTESGPVDLGGPQQQTLTPIPVTPSAQETATILLHRALRQAVWGPSVTCKIRLRQTLLEKQLVSIGTYAHAGQGSGQLKMHMRLAADERINTLIQVSDGRVLYSTLHLDGVSKRSRVDLYRIREYLGPITTASLEDPVIAMYLAVGGQAELLRKLVQQYKWTHVQTGRLGDVDVWWLSGELATEPPAIRALAEIDQSLFLPNKSGLKPTKVRLALGKGEPFPLWLYQVEHAREDSLAGIKSGTRLSMLMEFTEPNIVKELPPETFQSLASNDTIVEETRRYLPPTPAVAKLPTQNSIK